jgi:hypothetical protein
MSVCILKYSTQQIIDDTTKKINEIEKKRRNDLNDIHYLKDQIYTIFRGYEINFGYIFKGMPEEYEYIDIKDYGHKNLVILDIKTKNLIENYNYQYNIYKNTSNDKLIKKNELNLIEEKNKLKKHLDKLNAYKEEVEQLIKDCNNIIHDE